jgi:hypothetical protein
MLGLKEIQINNENIKEMLKEVRTLQSGHKLDTAHKEK